MSQKIWELKAILLGPLKIVYGWIVFHVFWFKPLENKVVFSSFSGKRYGDNPKYISEKLHEKYPEVKQVWIYDGKKLTDVPKYIKQVDRGSINMMRELATAKVWVDSHYQPAWVFKRPKGQFFLETWHGGLGFKKIGFEVPEKISLVEKIRIKHTAKVVDVWLSNSDWLSNAFRKGNLYKGEIWKSGLPKMAYLMNNESSSKKKVRDYYKLDSKMKIMVYAPTMRKNASEDDFKIDSESVLQALKKEFGGEWKIIIRLHPVNEAEGCLKAIKFSKDVLNGNKYADMQELIAAADVFVSDYSSAMFDSGILRHPTFCFAYDEKQYNKERGLCVDIWKLPFPVVKNNDELCRTVMEFNDGKYLNGLETYFEKVGLIEPKDSTEKVVELIWSKING